MNSTACVSGPAPTERLGQATLRLANGLPAGTAQLLASGAQVNISVAAIGVSPGAHGVHLHMTGSCEAPDFTSAGGHLNPETGYGPWPAVEAWASGAKKGVET